MTGQVRLIIAHLDHDQMTGETWGLYWSDYEDELRLILEESTDKYIIKHQEDKHSPPRHHPVTILECPQASSKPAPVIINLPDIHPPLEPLTVAPIDLLKTETIPDLFYSLPNTLRFVSFNCTCLHSKNIKCFASDLNNQLYLCFREGQHQEKVSISQISCLDCPPEAPVIKVLLNLLLKTKHLKYFFSW